MLNEPKFLKKRYLIWLYKTTKESIDRIDRKLTQLDIDYKLLKYFKKAAKNYPDISLVKLTEEFEIYIKNKEKDAIFSKFENGSKQLKPDYLFLKLKLEAVRQEIIDLLGKKGLKEISDLYENEMIERILKEREHK